MRKLPLVVLVVLVVTVQGALNSCVAAVPFCRHGDDHADDDRSVGVGVGQHLPVFICMLLNFEMILLDGSGCEWSGCEWPGPPKDWQLILRKFR